MTKYSNNVSITTTGIIINQVRIFPMRLLIPVPITSSQTLIRKWIHLQKGPLKLLLFRDALTKTLKIWMTNQTNMCLTFMSSHLFNGVYLWAYGPTWEAPHVSCCGSLGNKYYTKFGVSSHIASFLIMNI